MSSRYNAGVLEALVVEARRFFAVDASAYPAAVLERLELGAQRYSDDVHDGRDLLAELLEETPDVAGYVLLELRRLRELGEAPPAGVVDALLHAALHAAIADAYARDAQRARDRR